VAGLGGCTLWWQTSCVGGCARVTTREIIKAGGGGEGGGGERGETEDNGGCATFSATAAAGTSVAARPCTSAAELDRLRAYVLNRNSRISGTQPQEYEYRIPPV